MKYLYISMFVLFLAVDAQALKSTVKIPYKECAKYPYTNGIGGTMHSRASAYKKLIKSAIKKTHYTEEEAFKLLKKQHPELHIKIVKLIVKSCQVYFKAHSNDALYYFDAGNLVLLKTRNR